MGVKFGENLFPVDRIGFQRFEKFRSGTDDTFIHFERGNIQSVFRARRRAKCCQRVIAESEADVEKFYISGLKIGRQLCRFDKLFFRLQPRTGFRVVVFFPVGTEEGDRTIIGGDWQGGRGFQPLASGRDAAYTSPVSMFGTLKPAD